MMSAGSVIVPAIIGLRNKCKPQYAKHQIYIDYESKWGPLWCTQFAYELGCDLLHRSLIAEKKNDDRDKLLKEKSFYESINKQH